MAELGLWLCRWHFNNRTSTGHSGPTKPDECDMAPGAVAMPAVVQKLREIGEFILDGQGTGSQTKQGG